MIVLSSFWLLKYYDDLRTSLLDSYHREVRVKKLGGRVEEGVGRAEGVGK